MKTLIAAIFLAIAAAPAHAAGCLVFDATAPKTLDDGSVVYPISKTFPEVVPIKSCVAGAGSLIDSSAFLAVDVSPACHPIKVKMVVPNMTAAMAARIAAIPPHFITFGLYTDGKGNCGTLAVASKAVSTKASNWTGY